MELKRMRTSYRLKLQVLLIVPYGIETIDFHQAGISEVLLIVPYGIETKELDVCQEMTLFF